MLVTFCSLSLLFASGMASQAKKGEMLSTEEWQRNHQLISQIYTKGPELAFCERNLMYPITAVSSWDAEWRMLSRPGAKQFSHKAGEYN